jgi:hypothetical protein
MGRLSRQRQRIVEKYHPGSRRTLNVVDNQIAAALVHVEGDRPLDELRA